MTRRRGGPSVEWAEGYLCALSVFEEHIVSRGLWSTAIDELLEDLRQDAAEIAAEAPDEPEHHPGH